MQIINPELLNETLGGKSSNVKFILNDVGLVFFPVSQQHRDVKTNGLSYEDEYKGNAVAGLVTSNGVEIRFHKAYSDERIHSLWLKVRALSGFENPLLGKLAYQGREIPL